MRLLPLFALALLQAQTFRTSTTLIEFTVVALDAKGAPVTDLKQEDLVLAESGHPRDIAFFRFEGPSDPTPPRPLPPGAFTNRAEYLPGPRRNVTALVLDAINVAPAGQMTVRNQLLRYLQALPPNTRAALYRLGDRITVLHDFTSDPEALRARIAANDITLPLLFAKAGSMMPELGPTRAGSAEAAAAGAQAATDEARIFSIYNENVRDQRLAITLAGLSAIGDHLAAIPGRKSIVWVSSGMPLMASADGFLKSYAPAIRRTAQRLASQGIAIYPVTGLPLQARAGAALDIFAEVTGGRLVKVMNDFSQGLTTAASDVRATYSVGYYAAEEPDDRWRRLDVKTKRPGVKLLYRQGYLAASPPEQPLQWSEQQWRAAIANPLGSTSIRLDARLEPRAGVDAGHTLLLHIACDDLHFGKTGGTSTTATAAAVEIAIAEITAKGESAFHVATATLTLPENSTQAPADMVVRYTRNLKVRSGTATLRLIVRDQSTGRYGTLDIPFHPPPPLQ